MRGFPGPASTQCRSLGRATTVLGMAITLASTVGGAQEPEQWWDLETTTLNHLPEEIIALQREAEATDRTEATDLIREQIDLNARRWEEIRREHDRKLTEVFAAADEHARNAAKWQRRVQVLQLMGATLNFASAIQGSSLAPTERMEIAEDDLAGEEVVLCEESECVGISFSEALGALETAGTPEVGSSEMIQTLVELREGFGSMGPVRCSVELGECDAGDGPTREPAWVLPFAHAVRTAGMRLQGMFPRAVPRLKSLGRAANRLIQRSGAQSKRIAKKWGNHATEFRKDGLVTTRDGYARLAEHYMRRPPGTYRISHPDGRILIYDPNTNVFTSFKGDRFITMFRPGESIKYWLRDVQNANLTGRLVTGKPMKTVTWQTLPEKVRHQLERIARSGGQSQ